MARSDRGEAHDFAFAFFQERDDRRFIRTRSDQVRQRAEVRIVFMAGRVEAGGVGWIPLAQQQVADSRAETLWIIVHRRLFELGQVGLQIGFLLVGVGLGVADGRRVG